MTKMIKRAVLLLCYMSEEDVAGRLMEMGATAEDAFLAVKAARVYHESWQ